MGMHKFLTRSNNIRPDMLTKQTIKEVLKIFGLKVSKISTVPISPLLHHKVELLFDVGANVGQFALEKRAEGYKGKIISFEPLPEAYSKIVQRSKDDINWIVHNRSAVGAKHGEVEINIAGNSYSSSILPMLKEHSLAAPNSAYIGKVKTDVITLDSIFDTYRLHNETICLKIDTQGFEWEVLQGISLNLENIKVVQLELSIIPLYEDQYLYQHFFTFFQEQGFYLWSLTPGFFNPTTGQHLQFDATFVKND